MFVTNNSAIVAVAMKIRVARGDEMIVVRDITFDTRGVSQLSTTALPEKSSTSQGMAPPPELASRRWLRPAVAKL